MGKKRNTAKTGDKGLYRSRAKLRENHSKENDDDHLYNQVDRFHNERDKEFIRLQEDPYDDNAENDDGFADKEAVLDLGGSASSSESADSESESEDESEEEEEETVDEVSDEVSSSEDEDEIQDENIRDWGSNKRNLYGGDTADLEIGQEAEDAYLEEEAAKEVQAARYDDMDEDDFVLSDNDDSQEIDENHDSMDILSSEKRWEKLSRSTKHKFLQAHHPELLPLVNHFSETIQDWNDRTRVLVEALFSSAGTSPEDLGTSRKGLEYLLTKSIAQTSAALNVASYLLLKCEQTSAKRDDSSDENIFHGEAGAEIKSHPVIARLQQLNKINTKLHKDIESKVPTLASQIENLIKAAALMSEEQVSSDEEDQQSDTSGDASIKIDDQNKDVDVLDIQGNDEENKQNGVDEYENDVPHGLLNEARFGLRPQEVSNSSKMVSRQMGKRRLAPSADFGDEENESRSRLASQSLASTINSIQQRSSSKIQKSAKMDEDLDDQGDNDRLRRGLDMMEADLGEISNDEDGEIDDELDDGLDNKPNFYNQIKQKSDAKKALKKQLYQVAPKYPGIETEIAGERAISKTILKNRGLVAHKAKINRNPRVKKREQYRKAIIRRKGKVREIRTDEGHRYGGEGTGIKTGISRSRKLTGN